MQKFIITLICCLLPALAFADAPEIRADAPDSHVVVKGDTLWDISAEFFKDPWKWPQIWGLNKDTIKDPHWIYPGDVIVLDRATGTLHVGKVIQDSTPASPNSNVVKLSPQIRSEASEHDAIPTIPTADIEPFLSHMLILGPEGFGDAPTLVGTDERRVLLGTGDIGYVAGLPENKGRHWKVYRAGRKLIDPDSGDVLGQEAPYLGDAEVEKFGKISTIKITHAEVEITKGDRLYQPVNTISYHYMPHAPASKISARVISIYREGTQAGQGAIVTLNKGRRDGLEGGHVLALYRKGEKEGDLTLPDKRYGLLLVFLTFNKVAYAMVMQTRLPVDLLDIARTP